MPSRLGSKFPPSGRGSRQLQSNFGGALFIRGHLETRRQMGRRSWVHTSQLPRVRNRFRAAGIVARGLNSPAGEQPAGFWDGPVGAGLLVTQPG